MTVDGYKFEWAGPHGIDIDACIVRHKHNMWMAWVPMFHFTMMHRWQQHIMQQPWLDWGELGVEG